MASKRTPAENAKIAANITKNQTFKPGDLANIAKSQFRAENKSANSANSAQAAKPSGESYGGIPSPKLSDGTANLSRGTSGNVNRGGNTSKITRRVPTGAEMRAQITAHVDRTRGMINAKKGGKPSRSGGSGVPTLAQRQAQADFDYNQAQRALSLRGQATQNRRSEAINQFLGRIMGTF